MSNYSLNPNFGKISINSSMLQNKTEGFSVVGMNDNPLTRPMLGAEIGPDPRNATCRFALPQIPTQEAVDGIRFDFNHGYRIKIPEGKNYSIRITDNRSGLEILRRHYPNGGNVLAENKFFIDYKLEILKADSDEVVFTHDYDARGKRVNIIIPDGGLGDNIAWLPYPEEFRKKYGANTYCVAGEWLGRLVGDLYPEITFIPFSAMKVTDDTYASYFCAIFRPDRESWRPIPHQYLGMQRSIASIIGTDMEEVMPKVHLDEPRQIKEPYICISVHATNPCKYWNYPGGWNELIGYLNSIGYRVLCIDRDRDLVHKGKKYKMPEKAEDFTGCLPIQQRLDLLRHADFFIGLPSGLSWLAWAAKIPVVMISGFTMDPCEFYTPYRVTNFLYCHACWNDTHIFFDGTMPEWCPRHLGTERQFECTFKITTKMVKEVIGKVPEFQRRLKEHEASKGKK